MRARSAQPSPPRNQARNRAPLPWVRPLAVARCDLVCSIVGSRIGIPLRAAGGSGRWPLGPLVSTSPGVLRSGSLPLRNTLHHEVPKAARVLGTCVSFGSVGLQGVKCTRTAVHGTRCAQTAARGAQSPDVSPPLPSLAAWRIINTRAGRRPSLAWFGGERRRGCPCGHRLQAVSACSSLVFVQGREGQHAACTLPCPDPCQTSNVPPAGEPNKGSQLSRPCQLPQLPQPSEPCQAQRTLGAAAPACAVGVRVPLCARGVRRSQGAPAAPTPARGTALRPGPPPS